MLDFINLMDVATEKSNVTSNVTNYFLNKVIRTVT